MIPTIDDLLAAGYFSAIDVWFARTIARLKQEQDPLVLLAAAATSRFTHAGHVCLPLHDVAGTTIQAAEGRVFLSSDNQPWSWPPADQWLDALKRSTLVSAGDDFTPLVRDAADRLYLLRYWDYQTRLAAQLRARVRQAPPAVDRGRLADGLARLFSREAQRVDAPDHQRMAAALSVMRGFTVITGGPGTGKTSTVIKILALLAEQTPNKPLRALLLAPTGKAAARLGETLRAARENGPAAGLPPMQADAATIHRALGHQPERPTRFRHHADNPLPADVVIVDEASMVDLLLMTKLVEAVAPHARLVLLGDKDQLASVEAGAILGDICNNGRPWRYSAKLAADLADLLDAPLPHDPRAVPGVADHLVELTHSYRFAADSGIGRLAQAIADGRADDAMQLLADGGSGDLQWVRGEARGAPQVPSALIKKRYEPYAAARDPWRRLERLGDFRILCAHRHDSLHGLGVETMNEAVRQLFPDHFATDRAAHWYDGRPVVVTENDYRVNLFNGDVGVIGAGAADAARLTAHFVGADNARRELSLARLPAHETAFALTVHKSQGGEFNHVLLLLPAERSPVVTRELLYTAVTRARQSVTVVAAEHVIREAIDHRIHRASGLRDLLWSTE